MRKVVFILLLFTQMLSSQSTIGTRIEVPQGFTRTKEAENSFGFFLRNLPLKPVGTKVKYFDGTLKTKLNVYNAVVDLPIGNKDLHQCADAIMRLRSDFFYQKNQYDSIHFKFTNGFNVAYKKWREGYRIAIKNNKTSWVKTAKYSNSETEYWKYLEMIFNYAGTSSLEKELKPILIENIKIGDVFIKGGFPGHAVIVVDMAINSKNKQKAFLLAQSYMPAQELQILINPMANTSDKNWYFATLSNDLVTPEWTFKITQLKRF